MNRLAVVAAIVVLVCGGAGLLLGARDTSSDRTSAASANAPVVVTGAVVHPLAPDRASAELTLHNSADRPDALTDVQTGAGADARLYQQVVTVPAGGSTALTGAHRIVITQLVGPLRVGQYVNIQLTMRNAGQLLVTAPVEASTGSSSSVAQSSSPSGVHS